MLSRTRIEATDKDLSARGGLVVFQELIQELDWQRKLTKSLPAYRIATETSAYDKFVAMTLGLVADADCLDATERLGHDPAFTAICGKVNAANTYGTFLRRFGLWHITRLNHLLIDMALTLRSRIGKRRDQITITFDSTGHLQHGKKIEGCEINYKGEWGLDSLLAFDELGLQYWADVRPGATYTSNGVSEVVDAIFRRVARGVRRYALADSGFCNSTFFTACATQNVGFVTAMRANMYEPLIRRVTNWRDTKRVLFHDGRKCEIGTTLYRAPEGREILRVVMLRALKPDEQSRGLFGDMRFDYAAFVTNIGEHEMARERLVEAYRSRANAENYIKDLKHGFDLKHLPCLSLTANKAYALMAAFAYNLVRFVAHLESPHKPHFAKILRFRVLLLPVQVVKHARTVSFRFMTHHKEEVERWLEMIRKRFGCVGPRCGATTLAL